MLKKLFLLWLLVGSLAAQAQTKKPVPAKKPATPTKPAAPAAPSFKNLNDSLSYAMGLSAGQFLKAQGVENLNYALLNKAIEQTLGDKSTSFDMQAANGVMERFARTSVSKKASAEKEKGRQFLVQNKKKAGVTETASGLQFEVLTAGQGAKPNSSDTVVVHYAGKLLNGKEFDSSFKRGQPLTIPVAGVISGWTEALQLMPTGSKWRLYIPSDQAYGDMGAGRDIPGGATLVFDVELLEIKK
ncbi:FKBP-type peptidyl-prolyl cis-trans isomerase [Adhaeribacter rhizoryzae]|uniref:Peptidyl-prolyl cis-trans isomerase n=1 Tax=Adhaeribacter rhizoryzae TaxID=2607907 RepID=A0A5M6DJR9_9BACT|nr:FKBP-type peptidyl-prolyl cis-trans isomerase [Adhaeribacter rhizoryzae]KAA5546502.1 FKBP-type peptidyl-prolyl cis-trans isomerase [Adhaeribacter rhizoryzae]